MKINADFQNFEGILNIPIKETSFQFQSQKKV